MARPTRPTGPKNKEKPHWTFTDDGYRWDVRLSLLVMLMAVFLWLWLTPPRSAPLYLIAARFLCLALVCRLGKSRTSNRPGHSLKLGIILTVIGGLMVPDALYREQVDGPLGIQPMALLTLFSWAVDFAVPAIFTHEGLNLRQVLRHE